MMAERPVETLDTLPQRTTTEAGMRLIRCQKCANPIGRVLLRPGSAVEIKCHRCGIKTTEVR